MSGKKTKAAAEATATSTKKGLLAFFVTNRPSLAASSEGGQILEPVDKPSTAEVTDVAELRQSKDGSSENMKDQSDREVISSDNNSKLIAQSDKTAVISLLNTPKVASVASDSPLGVTASLSEPSAKKPVFPLFQSGFKSTVNAPTNSKGRKRTGIAADDDTMQIILDNAGKLEDEVLPIETQILTEQLEIDSMVPKNNTEPTKEPSIVGENSSDIIQLPDSNRVVNEMTEEDVSLHTSIVNELQSTVISHRVTQSHAKPVAASTEMQVQKTKKAETNIEEVEIGGPRRSSRIRQQVVECLAEIQDSDVDDDDNLLDTSAGSIKRLKRKSNKDAEDEDEHEVNDSNSSSTKRQKREKKEEKAVVTAALFLTKEQRQQRRAEEKEAKLKLEKEERDRKLREEAEERERLLQEQAKERERRIQEDILRTKQLNDQMLRAKIDLTDSSNNTNVGGGGKNNESSYFTARQTSASSASASAQSDTNSSSNNHSTNNRNTTDNNEDYWDVSEHQNNRRFYME